MVTKDNFHFILLPVDVPQAAEHEDEVGGAVLLLVLDQELLEVAAPTLGQEVELGQGRILTVLRSEPQLPLLPVLRT